MTSKKIQTQLEPILWILAVALCLSFCVQVALKLGFFVDETVDNSAAAYHFMKTGIYSAVRFSKPFDAEITSGLPLTWISGVVWLSGGSLFLQRVLLLAWHLGLFFALLALAVPSPQKVLGRFGLVRATFLLWMFLLFLIPNWQTVLQNLAEIQGAIFYAFAFLLLRRQPLLAGFLLGTAVWGCKVVILPGALLLIFMLPAWDVVFHEQRLKAGAASALKAFVGLFLPMLIWMAYITVRLDFDAALRWPTELFHFVTHQGGAGLSGIKYSLAERLSLSSFEWVNYPIGMKVRILFFVFAPVLVFFDSLLQLGRRWQKSDKAILALYAAFNLGYGYWWFFRHPVMIYRHFQFALVTSFLFLCWLYGPIIWRHFQARFPLRVALLLFLALYFLKSNAQYLNMEPGEGYYSQFCRDRLLTKACLTDTYWLLLPEEARE